MEPLPLPDGFAADWPKGRDFLLQLHLHPSGRPESERSSIGLYLTDQKPRGRLRPMPLANNKIDIAPGDSKFTLQKSITLRGPIEVYGLFPHMHLIGRTVKLTAATPDGASQDVLSIGDWDFKWQFYYHFASPLRFPAGTRFDCRWTYDNSADNPANPSHPPRRVRYGEQTTDEMGILALDVITQIDGRDSERSKEKLKGR
jgi:hypothetical protein